MRDVTPEWEQRQIDFFNNLTQEERVRLFVQTIQDVRETVERSIRIAHPEYSDIDVLLAVVDRYHGNEFTPEKMARIKASIREYHENKAKIEGSPLS